MRSVIVHTVTLGSTATQEPYRRIVRRSPRFQRGSPSRTSDPVADSSREPTPVQSPVVAPQVDPPSRVASIEKVGASLEGLFSKFAAFGATMQPPGPTPVALGQSTVMSPVAVSPPDDQPSSPGQPEDLSSKDIPDDSTHRRQNIRLTRDASMPPDEEPDEGSHMPPLRSSSLDGPNWDEPSSSPQMRKKRRVDDEDDSEVNRDSP